MNNNYLQTLFAMSRYWLGFLVLCGCQATFGPQALENTHPAYNQAIVNSLGQQMLLNLVRLKYRDSPYFLEVGSVTASLSLGASVGLDTKVDLGPGSDLLQPNAGVTYSQSPTISYTPLQGEDFLKSVLSPISLEALLVMTQSGWSIERVFGLTIERLNQLPNAPGASGPTPAHAPKYKNFKRVLWLLRRLQVDDLIQIGLDEKTKHLVILFESDPAHQPLIDELRSLLGVTHSEQPNRFEITSNFLKAQEHQWDVRVRSIAGVLFYLSQNVSIPEEHVNAGLVTVTKTQEGKPFNWGETPAGSLFQVQSSKARPTKAFIAVPYRGAWFYIADDDLQSKSSFMLLQELFSLQAGQIQRVGPTLTLPVRGK